MPEATLSQLKKSRYISESYVLIREIKTYLDISDFHVPLGIKIYLTDVNSELPYHYEVNANVHTPIQNGPYYPSRTYYETEGMAISSAVSDFAAYIEAAIEKGHKPSETWLVPNDRF
jgi:hypothetical protein